MAYIKLIKRILQRIKGIQYRRAISAKSLEARFTNIYKNNLWFGNRKSKSGAGSTLEATKQLRDELPGLLKELEATKFTDLGCGDYFWMKEVALPCPYLGLDVVAPVIQENQKKYTDAMHHFEHHNAVEDSLPPDTDVVMCREVLFHLSFEDGIKLIQQVLSSNARYFLVTTSDVIQENKDIRTGQFRNINLMLPPYNFPEYQSKMDDNTISANRILGLWEVTRLKETVPY